MNINEAFPSNYLKASDLKGHTVTVVMERCEWKQVGSDTKLVLFFRGKEKGMIVNKTNANTIATIYGPETDGWMGQPITLFEQMVDYRGQMMPGLRCMRPRDNQPQPAAAPVERQPGEDSELDSSIPF